HRVLDGLFSHVHLNTALADVDLTTFVLLPGDRAPGVLLAFAHEVSPHGPEGREDDDVSSLTHPHPAEKPRADIKRFHSPASGPNHHTGDQDLRRRRGQKLIEGRELGLLLERVVESALAPITVL